VIPGWELWFTASRSSGAGGQHVNRTNSRVSLHWVPATTSALPEDQRERLVRRLWHRLTTDGMLVLHVDENRSQHRNLELARERLVALLEAAMRPRKPRVATKVSEGQKRIRLAEKRSRGVVKSSRKAPGDDEGEP
jgi:ribosome-associated protein